MSVRMAAFLLAPAIALAQPGPRRGGWTPGAQYMRLFDPKTVTTVKGEVVRLEKIPMMRHTGRVAAVKTSEGEISVHLGPDWFIDHQDLQLAAGDQVEVRGSKVTYQGKPALIAIEVKRGEDTLRLRDESGIPVWAAWRRGP